MIEISKPKKRNSLITIAGNAGVGKSSLAALFPNPIFIRVEDGLSGLDDSILPDAMPLVKEPQDVWDQLTFLVKENHDYKTVVIDSVTRLESLFIQSILDKKTEKATSINTAMGGYGAGRSAVSSMHYRVRKAAGILNEIKNMNVIFIAHADTEQMDLPDTQPYMRYTIRMHQKSVSPYIDDVDVVAFVKLETILIGEDDQRKKAISDGTRIIDCVTSSSTVAKNRYGIKDTFVFTPNVNPFIDYLPVI